jgi:hypothetical protein
MAEHRNDGRDGAESPCRRRGHGRNRQYHSCLRDLPQHDQLAGGDVYPLLVECPSRKRSRRLRYMPPEFLGPHRDVCDFHVFQWCVPHPSWGRQHTQGQYVLRLEQWHHLLRLPQKWWWIGEQQVAPNRPRDRVQTIFDQPSNGGCSGAVIQIVLGQVAFVDRANSLNSAPHFSQCLLCFAATFGGHVAQASLDADLF